MSICWHNALSSRACSKGFDVGALSVRRNPPEFSADCLSNSGTSKVSSNISLCRNGDGVSTVAILLHPPPDEPAISADGSAVAQNVQHVPRMFFTVPHDATRSTGYLLP